MVICIVGEIRINVLVYIENLILIVSIYSDILFGEINLYTSEG